MFDLRALHKALDQKRLSLGLTWEQAAQEVAGNPKAKGHQISASTLRNTERAGQMEADGVLAMVRWLGLTFQHFTRGGSASALLTSEMRGSRRFDSQAFYAALERKRQTEKMTWRKVASQLHGFSPGMLTRLAERGRLSVEQVVVLSDWLGLPPEEFTYSREA